MARPVKHRRICELPRILEFGPCSNQNAGVTELAVDEYEAIRLIDYLDFTQEECAVQMRVARTTVQSIYDSARKKIADALINGKRLVIRGGCYDICSHAGKCCGKNCARRKRSAMCCENCELHCQRSRNKVDKA